VPETDAMILNALAEKLQIPAKAPPDSWIMAPMDSWMMAPPNSWMMAPGSRHVLATIFLAPRVAPGQALMSAFVRARRMLSPLKAMRWAL